MDTNVHERSRTMSPASLTLVLPAFNEEDRLGAAMDELFGYLRQHEAGTLPEADASVLPNDIRVVVVDDGSSDRTAEIAATRPEATGSIEGVSLRVLTVPHGGKGAAVRAGMLDATSDLIIFTDADMATPPDQLPLLLRALANADVALGSRIQPDGSDMRASQPFYR